MNADTVILIAEDDEGHAALIKRSLVRCGIENPVMQFSDGQQVLDFLFAPDPGHSCKVPERDCLLLLDIRMPKVDGIGVLRKIKADQRLKDMPVVMITTTEDPIEVENCYALGCSSYMVKPVDHLKFSESMRKLGLPR